MACPICRTLACSSPAGIKISLISAASSPYSSRPGSLMVDPGGVGAILGLGPGALDLPGILVQAVLDHQVAHLAALDQLDVDIRVKLAHAADAAVLEIGQLGPQGGQLDVQVLL